jgi:hypothetical protein
MKRVANRRYTKTPLPNSVPVSGADGLLADSFITGGSGSSGYSIPVMASNHNPNDSTTYYIGGNPAAPSTTAALHRIYFGHNTGRITLANVYTQAVTTAGSNEAWSAYIRVNNTTDYLIATLSLSTAERLFFNDALNISLVYGDYFQIKLVTPAWAINPAGVGYGGYVFVEGAG